MSFFWTHFLGCPLPTVPSPLQISSNVLVFFFVFLGDGAVGVLGVAGFLWVVCFFAATAGGSVVVFAAVTVVVVVAASAGVSVVVVAVVTAAAAAGGSVVVVAAACVGALVCF